MVVTLAEKWVGGTVGYLAAKKAELWADPSDDW